MATEPFKLDTLMLHHVIATGSPEQWGERASAELARQLHAAGGPDAPFEEQLRALLASHLALVQTGEEMPSAEDCVRALDDYMGDDDRPDCDVERMMIKAILALFAPLLARLTQERDEARANHDRSSGACQSLADEIDALRQRAERAERELAVERSAHGGARADASHLKEQLDAALARIAELEGDRGAAWKAYADERAAWQKATGCLMPEELESRPEPSAAVVTHLIALFRQARTAAVVGPYNPHTEAEKIGRGERDGIRAVISALAETGEEAWPAPAECTRGLDAKADAWEATNHVYDELRSRLAPVLGAQRVRIAELEADANNLPWLVEMQDEQQLRHGVHVRAASAKEAMRLARERWPGQLVLEARVFVPDEVRS